MGFNLVPEKNIAETYDSETGWETVTQYRRATELAREQPELARAEIARRVGRSPSALRGWLAEGKTPPPVKAITTARDHGWINIDATSETFRALNHLVAWMFSGGGLRRDRFVPIFSVDDRLALATLDRLLTWADLPYRIREHDDSDRAFEIKPSEDASVFGRILHVLGVPRGIKATHQDLRLPAYLDMVPEAYRRDFVRTYLLNRGAGLGTGRGRGVYVPESRSTTYCQSLRDLFASVTNEAVTLNSQQRLWVSAAAVRDLACGTPIRPAIATQVAFGTLTPPTERALASTYRRGKQPSGYRYAQLYDEVMDTDVTADELVERYPDLEEQSIRNWRHRGHVPDVYEALNDGRSLDWVTPPSESEVGLALTALVGWVFARGSLRSASYFPVFRIASDDHQALFTEIADTLGISYSLVRDTDQTRPTEIHPSSHGGLLGRVLYALGAPRGAKREQICLPPAYLWYTRAHARQFITMWCRHRTTASDDGLSIVVPAPLREQFADAFARLIDSWFSVDVTRTQTGVEIHSPPDELC